MQELEYIDLYKRIFKIIPSEKVAMMITQEMGKDRRQANIPNKFPASKEVKKVPATISQIKELKRINKFREGMSKSEAWKIINESR